MNFVSLFAGVGGFDLGLEQSGHTCIGQVEIDPQCVKVLKHRWPDVPKWDDVTTAKEWADEIGLVGRTDIVCGGFPCQDVSVAGKRAGLAGKRSGLFFDALEFAVHVKAERLILENVPGLLSSNNGRDFGVVISEMANAGYRHIEWRVLDSQFFGVPQRRRRVFIVGSVADRSGSPIFIEREGLRRDTAESNEARQSLASAAGTGFGQSSFAGYTEGVTTITATTYKRPEENIVVTSSSFGGYEQGLGTLRASGGDLGGGSENLVVQQKQESTDRVGF
jgi:DNA (cytosine-5)-methyltransferase 1